MKTKGLGEGIFLSGAWNQRRFLREKLSDPGLRMGGLWMWEMERKEIVSKRNGKLTNLNPEPLRS